MDELRIVTSIDQQIKDLENEIKKKKQSLAELRRKAVPKEINNYTFMDLEGNEVELVDLFGDKEELILIFNMGKDCRYCTLWADGFNGLTDHLENRAAFVLVTPNKPEEAKEFAESRNWRFKVFSDHASGFRTDLGFKDEKGVWPAAAVFTKDEEDNIFLRSSTVFGPGDNYAIMWDFIDLLPSGWNKWEPKYEY